MKRLKVSPVGKVTYGEAIVEGNTTSIPITVTWDAKEYKAWVKSQPKGRYVTTTSDDGRWQHWTWTNYRWWQLIWLEPKWWLMRLKRRTNG